jgi:hypothetical protein
MSRFLYTQGQPTLGIGICGRCFCKLPLAELMPDPNSPALMVCKDDLDELDPYRLPARQVENLVLPFTRPDQSVATQPNGLVTQDDDYFIITEDGEGYYVP